MPFKLKDTDVVTEYVEPSVDTTEEDDLKLDSIPELAEPSTTFKVTQEDTVAEPTFYEETKKFLSDIGEESKNYTLGPVGLAADMTYDATAKGLTGMTQLPWDVLAIGTDVAKSFFEPSESGVLLRLERGGGEFNLDPMSPEDAKIALGYTPETIPEDAPDSLKEFVNWRYESKGTIEALDSTGRMFQDIGERTAQAVDDLIPGTRPEEGSAVDTVTDVMALVGGGAKAGIEGAVAREAKRQVKGAAIPKNLNTPIAGFKTAAPLTKTGKLKEAALSSVDIAKGEALVAGSGTLDSFIGSEEDQGTPLQRRAYLPLEGLLSSLAFDTALAGGRILADNKAGKAVTKQITDLYNKIPKKQLPPAQPGSSIVQDNILQGYLKKKFKYNQDTDGFDTKLFSMIGFNTSIRDQFSFVDNLERQKNKLMNIKQGSRDTLEMASYNDARLMRENNQAISYLMVLGDEGVPYFDKYGVVKLNKNIPTLKMAMGKATKKGAAVEATDEFRAGLDALDNYATIKRNTQGTLQSLITYVDDTNIYASMYTKNPQPWNELMSSFFKGNNALVRAADVDTAKKIVEIRVKEAVKTVPKDHRKAVQQKLNEMVDNASRRSTYTFEEATYFVNKHLKNSPWAKELQQDISKWNSHWLDLQVDAGMISAKTAGDLRAAHPNYLPNFKDERTMGFIDETSKVQGKKNVTELKRRKISTKKNVDPIAANLEYSFVMGNAVTESRVRASLFKWMQQWGGDDWKFFTYADKDKILKAKQSIDSGGKQNFSYEDLLENNIPNEQLINFNTTKIKYNGGELEIPIRNKTLYSVMQAGGGKSTRSQLEVMTSATIGTAMKVFRNLIVYDPSFAVKTFGQEMHDKMINSNAKVLKRLDLGNTMKALIGDVVDPEAYRQFQNNYGFYGVHPFQENRLGHDKMIEKYLRDINGTKTFRRWVVDGADDMLRRVDFAPRVAYYNQLRSIGYTEAEAMSVAKDLGVRFTQRGTIDNLASRALFALPFMRTTVNSIDRFARRWRFEGLKASQGLATSSLVTWVLDKQIGEDGQSLSTQRRAMSIPLSEEETIVVSYGFTTPSYPAHKTISFMTNYMDEVMGGVILDSLEAVDPEMAKAIRKDDPTGARVALEWANWFANVLPKYSVPGYDTYRTLSSGKTADGIPIMSYDLQDKPSELQYNERTSASMKLLGEQLGMSPIKMEYAFNSIVPNVGAMALQMSDHVLAQIGVVPEQPRVRLGEVPFFDRFMQTRNGAMINQLFYNVHAEAANVNRMIEGYKEEAETNPEALDEFDHLTRENSDFLEVYSITKDTQRNIKKYKEYAKALREGYLPEWKNEYDADFFGSAAKRDALFRIKNVITEEQVNAINMIKQVTNGQQMLEVYSIPYSRTIEDMSATFGIKDSIYENSKGEADYDDGAINTYFDTILDESGLKKEENEDWDKFFDQYNSTE